MQPETNEKVLSMYQAVWMLIDEGNDINKMKVADITARAGIGKGTAYEYFRSKEELVGKAVQYEFYRQYQVLTGRLAQQRTFRGALENCFEWLEENRDRRQFTMQLLRRMGIPGDSDTSGMNDDRMAKEMQCGTELSRRILEYLVELGRGDGTIPGEVPLRMASLQILAQLLGFFVYQEMGMPLDAGEVRNVKDYLYENLKKCFQQQQEG